MEFVICLRIGKSFFLLYVSERKYFLLNPNSPIIDIRTEKKSLNGLLEYTITLERLLYEII